MKPAPGVLVLRPEPGATATLARLAAANTTACSLPLFALEPLPWAQPDRDGFDALLLTSANAVRLAGPSLGRYHDLPCWCVGAATARAARAAGLQVEQVGDSDGRTLLASAATLPPRRWLWLTGETNSALNVAPPATLLTLPVYRAVARGDVAALDAALSACPVALLHSPAAARRLASLVPPERRSPVSLVAISPAVAAAAGPGWAAIHTAAQPDDAEMVAIAAKLCHKPG